jgi:hypothetical protein
MPLALETLVTYIASGTGSTTFDAVTFNSNQSATVRSYQPGTGAYLENVWAATSAAPWLISIKSPRMHDDVLGMEFALGAYTNTGSTVIFNPQELIPGEQRQYLYATDTLSITGNATTGTNKLVAVMNVYYDDLGGVSSRLYSWNTIKPMIKNTAGFLCAVQASGTVGVFGTGVALNASSSRWKANTDYAILGYSVSTPVAAVVINGVDVGNLYVGGPGLPNTALTGQFFVDQDRLYGTPHIPVINSLNVGGTFAYCADITASTSTNLVLHVAELNQRITG